jgi:hypothetical protein
MRLPWVSRAEMWRLEHRALQAALLTPAVQAVPEPPVRPTQSSLVAETIHAESGGNPRLAAHFWKRVRELRREGKSDGDIADQLSKWQSTEDDDVAL